jgi:predicted N-acyltransferase
MKVFSSVLEIPQALWDKLTPQSSPFLSYDFFKALEASGSVGRTSGWEPLFILDEEEEGLVYTFIKSHSYGEYIFDWQWARAYQENGLPYYPKLTSMVPFTPATTPHFLMPEFDKLKAEKLLNYLEEIFDKFNFSSNHFLFISPEEASFFKEQDYLIRESMQYHFINEDYVDFPSYLGSLKTKKAKSIEKERLHTDLSIKRFSGNDLKVCHAQAMYRFYLSTIDHKHATDYLKEDFFLSVFDLMKNQVLYVEASRDDAPIAGSLFFIGNERLYGRYWGATEYRPNLHFELCYYQGIEFCLERKLKVFEAGAQGEHKIPRGFRPIKTFSAHKIKHEGFNAAISNYIEAEKAELSKTMDQLSHQLPFRHETKCTIQRLQV